VNLVEEVTITAQFKITYSSGPTSPDSVAIDVIYGSVDDATLLAECQETYGNANGVTCESVEENEDGMTQVNFEGKQFIFTLISGFLTGCRIFWICIYIW
jgi:hypothetical protein